MTLAYTKEKAKLAFNPKESDLEPKGKLLTIDMAKCSQSI